MATSKYLRINQLKRSDCHVDSCYYRQNDRLFTIFAHSNYLSVWFIHHTINDASLDNHDNNTDDEEEEDDDDIDIDTPLINSLSNNKDDTQENGSVLNYNDSHSLEGSCVTEHLPIEIENARITSINTFER